MPHGDNDNRDRVAALDPLIRRRLQARLTRAVANLVQLARDCDAALGLPPGTCDYYLGDTTLHLMAGESHAGTDDSGAYVTRPQERQGHVIAYASFPGSGGGW